MSQKVFNSKPLQSLVELIASTWQDIQDDKTTMVKKAEADLKYLFDGDYKADFSIFYGRLTALLDQIGQLADDYSNQKMQDHLDRYAISDLTSLGKDLAGGIEYLQERRMPAEIAVIEQDISKLRKAPKKLLDAFSRDLDFTINEIYGLTIRHAESKFKDSALLRD